MKINKQEIVFLIRAFNEGKKISEVIDSIRKDGFHNILVVDDGSSDNTFKKVSHFKDIILLRHHMNRGGGAALETGLEYLRRNATKLGFHYVVTFDADGQHDIKDINKFIEQFEHHKSLDIVFGSRFIKKTKSNVPFFRKMILMGGKIFTYMISGIYLTDSHNGYRMIQVKSLDKIHLTMSGMEYASELIEEVKQNRLIFKEVPVNIIYNSYTLSKGQKNKNAIRIVGKMLYKKFIK